LEGLRETLGLEARTRAEEIAKLAADVAKMSEEVVQEANERRKGDDLIILKIQACADELHSEKQGHGNTRDELGSAVQDMTAKIEAERLQRDKALADLKQDISGFKADIADEKIERAQDITKLRDEAEEMNCTTKQNIDNLKQDVVGETYARESAVQHIGKLMAEHKATLEELEKSCDGKFQNLTDGQLACKEDLEKQAQLLADLQAKTEAALNALRDAQSEEGQKRMAEMEELRGSLNAVRDMVDAESHDRTEALNDANFAISQVKDHVDREVHDRKKAEEEMQIQMQALLAKLAAEKEKTEAEIDSLKSHDEKIEQELVTEKNERSSSVAANKHELQQLHTQLSKQLQDMEHSLEEEGSHRTTSDKDIEKQLADTRTALEANITSNEAMLHDLELTMRLTKQALAQETQERAMSFDDNAHKINEAHLQHVELRKDYSKEVEDRVHSDSDLQATITKNEENLGVKLSDIRDALDQEQRERTTKEESLQKQIEKLRAAVLVAVRGSEG